MSKTTTAAKVAAPKTEKVTAEKKGLSKPQVRILAALAKAKAGLPAGQIAEKANVDKAWVGTYIGRVNVEIRKPDSLLSRKFVTVAVSEEGGKVFSITATGRKALEAAK